MSNALSPKDLRIKDATEHLDTIITSTTITKKEALIQAFKYIFRSEYEPAIRRNSNIHTLDYKSIRSFYSLPTKLRNISTHLEKGVKRGETRGYNIIYLRELHKFTPQERKNIKRSFKTFTQEELLTAYTLYQAIPQGFIQANKGLKVRDILANISATEKGMSTDSIAYTSSTYKDINYDALLNHIHTSTYWSWKKDFNTEYKRTQQEELTGKLVLQGDTQYGSTITLTDITKNLLESFLSYISGDNEMHLVSTKSTTFINSNTWNSFFKDSNVAAMKSALESFGIIKPIRKAIRGFASTQYVLSYDVHSTTGNTTEATDSTLKRMRYLKTSAGFSRDMQLTLLMHLQDNMKLGMIFSPLRLSLSAVINDLGKILSMIHNSRNHKKPEVRKESHAYVQFIARHFSIGIDRIIRGYNHEFYINNDFDTLLSDFVTDDFTYNAYIPMYATEKAYELDYNEAFAYKETSSTILDEAYVEASDMFKHDDYDLNEALDAFTDQETGRLNYTISKLEMEKFVAVFTPIHIETLSVYLGHHGIELSIEVVEMIIEDVKGAHEDMREFEDKLLKLERDEEAYAN